MKILTRFFRNFLFLSLLFPATFLLVSFTTDPTIIETILKKLKLHHTDLPQEKLYLHLDKPFYAAGENLWFKAYLMEASFHSLDSQSRVVYVELIDADKVIFKRQMLYAAGGVTFGDFELPDTLHEGRYAVRAYTNYMKNAGEDFFFIKEFPVLNPLSPAKKENAKFGADSLELQFFPEGGNFVACGFNRLGFKALSPDGKGINVEGNIIDDNNTVITTFKSQHNGMGMVRINPVKGRKYFAQITKPYAVNRAYPLPEVHEKGYIMQVDAVNKNIKVIVFTNADNPASGNHTVNLVVQSRGNAYHAQQGTINGNAFFTVIPKSKFPDGISQITVFDAEGRPVAERLIHQNHNETINLLIETDTARYGKRKMVTVLADAVYQNGSPAQGNFSISVYDEGLITDHEKYPLSIKNYLSLTSDLKGHIEDPGYYFKDSLPETKKNLDLLMMVNGWRRFTWNDVLAHQAGEPAYKREGGIPIQGKVLKAGGKRPPAGSILKVLTMDGKAIRLRPDSLGRFYTDSLLYYDSMSLVFQTENLKGKKQPYKFALDPLAPPPPTDYEVTAFEPFDASKFLQQQADEKLISNLSKGTVLQEVKITAKKEVDPRIISGRSGRVLDIKKIGSEGYGNVFQIMQTRLPGVIVTGSGNSYTVKVRGQDPAFAIDGRLSNIDMVGMIAPSDVEYIEIIPNAVQFGAMNAINIILRAGAGDREPVGVSQVKYPGFYQAREFYSPNYDVKDNRHSLEDKRTTLFWEPMIITDAAGRAAVAFFTNDRPSRYRVVVEGITHDGYPGMATTVFDVK